MTFISQSHRDDVEVIRLRSAHLEVEVAPEVGGRIVQIRHLASGHDFLWQNASLPLRREPPGSEYDPKFFGGIDELIPSDIAETVDGVAYPDHGELWTTPLTATWHDPALVLRGRLPLCGLLYERRMSLRPSEPILDLDYRITNDSAAPRHFAWKLHAPLAIEAGDRIVCPARRAQVGDLAYSRFQTLEPFTWPQIEGQSVEIIPPPDNTTDFFYLYDLSEGRIAWTRASLQLRFECRFDLNVFPFIWLFASYGGFMGHYTAIFEPCTSMPMGIDNALENGRCSRLEPGEVLETRVSLYAGRDE